MSKSYSGAESGRMPEGRRSADKSGEKARLGMGGAESGCMPKGRRIADRSGDQVKPWKSNGER